MLIYELSSVISENLPQAPGISPRLRSLLYARGAKTIEEMEQFLHPGEGQFCDPFDFKDMDIGAERIRAAVGNQRICVFGDYDADGVCATAILADCLASMGADVIYRIPSRHEEGYGLSIAAVERLKQEGVGLIVTVDNGVKAYGEIDRCRELGMDVVVTDHHRCDGRIPECCAVVCHTRDDNTYPNRDLCGAGIAWKLAEALIGRQEAKKYLPIAAIATMADVVPLLGENRAIVALGLNMINEGLCCAGIKALGRAVNEKNDTFAARDLSFGFAPRLNAAGRMEDASICVELLCTKDMQRAEEIARRLDELNRLRQKEESSIVDEAAEMTEGDDLTVKRCIVLKSENWNPGVIGIAASRIAERYYRPTLLFTEKEGVLTGSARSVPGVDLYSALNANSRFFTRFGGHAFAAGVTMPAESFDEFAEALNDTFRQTVPDELFIPRRTYEAEVELAELTLPMAEELELLAPFGEGNPEPSFRTRGMLLRGIRRIGSTGSHIKATAVKADRYIDLVAFAQGHRFDELNDMDRCDAIYTPNVNRWNGMRSVQLRIRDMRADSVEDPEAYVKARREKFIDAFSMNVLYNINCDDIEDKGDISLKELLCDPIGGSMILCFTSSGAAELIGQLRREEMEHRMDVLFTANRPSPCAYHTAVLAPVLDRLELSRFRDIMLYDSRDKGLSEHIARLAPHARVHLGNAKPLDEFFGLAMDRDDFAVFYRAAKGSERRFYNRGELADYLAGVAKKPLYMARLAADIMLELGFASEQDGITMIKEPKRADLGQSATYAALQRIKA